MRMSGFCVHSKFQGANFFLSGHQAFGNESDPADMRS
jgi:hypothetical protein